MFRRFKIILIFTFVILSALLGLNQAAFAGENFKVKTALVDNAGQLLLIKGTNEGKEIITKESRLLNPDRELIDIQNGILIGQKKSIDLADTGIKNVKIAQFSTNPNAVRLVFTADTAENLKNLSVNKSQNSLVIRFNDIKTGNKGYPVVYQDKMSVKATNEVKISDTEPTKPIIELKLDQITKSDNKDQIIDLASKFNPQMVINTIKMVNNHLTIAGRGTVSVKEPLILQNPSRIVFDITNATLESKDLIKSFVINTKDEVKIGQFDHETVRIVVNTDNPDSYKPIISADLQSLIITPKDKMDISELPDNDNFAQIQKINVVKQDALTTSITLVSDNPIIQSVKRSYNKLNFELHNVHAPAKNMITALPKTKQFKGIDISSIEKYPNGSKWSFNLGNNSDIETRLSFDGKIMEITIKDSPYTTTFSGTNKVVIDAGHGGYEPGANRVGIYEKDINLDIAKRVRYYLNKAGINVVMTREGDDTVSLKQRTMVSNAENPAAFVSIHVNSSQSSNAKGLETHWYTDQSRKFAEIMHNSLINSISSPNRGIFRSMFYVIHHTNAPSLLVEIGFISNDAERYDMLTEQRKEATARAISGGILKFLSSNK